MKEWIISVTIIAVLTTIPGLFLSEGKTKKYIVGITRVILLFFVFQPIVSFLSQNNFNFDIAKTETEAVIQTKDESGNDFYIKLVEIELKNKGIPCSVQITIENDQKYADIYLEQSVINEQEGNIYKNSNEVIQSVEKYLPIKKEQIRVYGRSKE